MRRSEIFQYVIVALLLFLSVTLGMVIMSENSGHVREWSLNSSYLRTDAIYVGNNDTFITIAGNQMYAIGQNGIQKWSLNLPMPESGLADFSDVSIDQAAAIGDNNYFLIKSNDRVLWDGEGEIVAISADGRLLWSVPCYTLYEAKLFAVNNTVYLYNTHDITAYDQNGTYLWKLGSVFYTPSVDESGDIHFVQYQYPGGGWILKSYTSGGKLTWSQNLSDLGMGEVKSYSIGQIISHKGLNYVFVNDGIAAIDRTGELKWKKAYGASTIPIGFDTTDRLYLVRAYPGDVSYDYKLTVLSPDGNEVATQNLSDRYYFDSVLSDGILYEATTGYSPEIGLDHLNDLTLTAYDVITGEFLWSQKIEPDHKNTVILTESLAKTVLPWYRFKLDLSDNRSIEKLSRVQYSQYSDTSYIQNFTEKRVMAGDKLVYVSYWAYNYEAPLVWNKSKCTYAGGIYAYNRAGDLVWEKQIDSFVTRMVEQNGTVYYETSDGRFSAATINVAAGIIVATIYLLLRLFVAGTVTRARSRLDKNQNRIAIQELIYKYPGLTQHELARHSCINLGTVRYHLLVLTLNHKITTYTDDTKFIRYFKNSSSYSDDEKQVIAMIRREPIRRLLALITEGRCSSNLGMSRELNMPESAVSKYLRELQVSGVIVKNTPKNDGLCYMVNERYGAALKAHLTDDLDDVNRFQTSIGVE